MVHFSVLLEENTCDGDPVLGGVEEQLLVRVLQLLHCIVVGIDALFLQFDKHGQLYTATLLAVSEAVHSP